MQDKQADPRAASRGAGLVETIVVLALAGLLLGAAWPRVAVYLEEVELRSAVLRLAEAIVRGRVAALGEGRTWELRLAGASAFVLAPLGESRPAEPLPAGTFVAEATSGGDVRFFSSGLVDNATFTLAAGSLRRRVIVNQRGRVTVE